MLEAFKGHERKDTSNLLAFVAAMILGLSESTMQAFFKVVCLFYIRIVVCNQNVWTEYEMHSELL